MQLIYLKEGRRYTDDGLIDSVLFQLGSTRGEYVWLNTCFVRELRDAMNKERHAAVRGEKTHVFHYLGLFDFTDRSGHNLTFFFLPKFLDLRVEDERDEEAGEVRDDRNWEATKENLESWKQCYTSITAEMRNSILLAIDRYHKEDSELGEEMEVDQRERESVLELAVRVLRDYLENGAYIVHRAELEQCGQGEVDWDATIDRCDPLFMDGDPVYADYFSLRAESDENYYITRLQRSLVTFWGRKLEALGLASVLGVNVPPVSEEELDLLGEPDYQVAQIDRELKIQFVTKARETLKLMKALIQRRTETLNTSFEKLSFGMTGVEHLWETACAKVLGSELEEPLVKFGLHWKGRDETGQLKDMSGIKFDKFMPRIQWRGLGGRREEIDNDKGSQRSKKAGWRLDFIRTYPPHDVNPQVPAEKLVILDAKYYCAVWRKNEKTDTWTISGQPGTPDITKQMYYQMVFKDLQEQNHNLGIVNAFLLPEDDRLWDTNDKERTECPYIGEKGAAGLPSVVKSETISWNRVVCAFSEVRLFTVRVPGLRLLERYAKWDEPANDWFEKIVGFDGSRTEGNTSTPNSTGSAPVPSKVEPPLKKPVEQTDPKGNDVNDADSKDAGSVSRSEDLKEESCVAKDQPKGDETKGTTDVSSEGESDDTLAAESEESNANANSNVEKANIEPIDQDGKLAKDFIRDVMSVPSFSGKEGMMKEYIQRFAEERGIKVETDAKGNLYLTKREVVCDDYYLCLVNHMDTAQAEQGNNVDRHERLLVKEREMNGKTELYVDGMGIGADDKLGCAIALALIDQLKVVKAVFFVEEERGMLGSQAMNVEWFKDVAFCLSFDSPERNRSAKTCSSVPLYSENFFKDVLKPVCRRHGITKFRDEPDTDVVQIRKKTPIMCYNVGNGGYKAHQLDEYLIVEDAQAAYAFGKDLLESMK